MNLLKQLAIRLLAKEIQEHYISRIALDEYAVQMKQDFPVMQDMKEYFEVNRNFHNQYTSISMHCQLMRIKHGLVKVPSVRNSIFIMPRSYCKFWVGE